MAFVPHFLFLVLTFCFFLILLGRCEAQRGGTRRHSGQDQGERYHSSAATISSYSAYRQKLTHPCRYRPSVGKRSAPAEERRVSQSRGSGTHHPTNILWQLISQTFLGNSLEGHRQGRTRREVLEQSIGALELRNLLTGIQFIITEHLLLQLNYSCGTLKPSTLSALPQFGNSSLQQASRTLLRSIADVRAHIFFMRLDWRLSPGLPCVSVSQVRSIMNNYQRLDEKLSDLTCKVLQTSFARQPLTAVADVSSITTTPISRYSSCPARNIRDCGVVFYLQEMLRNFDIFLANYSY